MKTLVEEEVEVQVRCHGSEELPALVYLPGLHGDWTLIGGFRKAMAGKVRFIELTYPRTVTWSLQDYADQIIQALADRGIKAGWLLAESFGSQVAWHMLASKRFRTEGVILAGGFGRHPWRRGVLFAERVTAGISLAIITRILFGYAWVSRWRFRKEPEVLAGVEEFIARRTEPDRQAAKHRLHLIAENDPCELVRNLKRPVYGITGLLDPIVPWFLARGWLRRNCPTLQDYRIIPADHNVLSTASKRAAEQVLEWIGVKAKNSLGS